MATLASVRSRLAPSGTCGYSHRALKHLPKDGANIPRPVTGEPQLSKLELALPNPTRPSRRGLQPPLEFFHLLLQERDTSKSFSKRSLHHL